jgi:nucleoside-diphosphate-sugar epimerase
VKRVLVTGGSGFVGAHSLPLIVERGYEVHASHLKDPGPQTAGITWHRADLLDADETAALVEAVAPTHLLHFAWYAEPREFWHSEQNLRWVEASLRLLRAFASNGGERAVFAGSCAEYDWSGAGWDGVCSEYDTPLHPATLYGVCKLCLGAIASSWAAGNGMSLASGRIFFAYGPAEDPRRLVSSVARALVKGEPAPCSEGSQRRDFLHTSDIAAGFVALLDSEVTGAVNIGSGTATAIRDVVSLIAAATGRPELVRFGELASRPDEPSVLEADVRRLRNEVGWSPSLSLEQGIQQVVEWWKANG